VMGHRRSSENYQHPRKYFIARKSAVRHVTTLRVNRFFTRQTDPDPRSGGDASVHRSTVRKVWPRFSLATKLWPPRPVAYQSARSTLYRGLGCQAIPKINEETIVLQIVGIESRLQWLRPPAMYGLPAQNQSPAHRGASRRWADCQPLSNAIRPWTLVPSTTQLDALSSRCGHPNG
jgi:hypothetical protein